MKKIKYAEKMVDLIENYLLKNNVSPDFTIEELYSDEDYFAIRLEHDATGHLLTYELQSLYDIHESEDVKIKDQFKDFIKNRIETFVEQNRNYSSNITEIEEENEEEYEDDDFEEDFDDEYYDDEDYENEDIEDIEEQEFQSNGIIEYNFLLLEKSQFEENINKIIGNNLMDYIFQPIGNTDLIAVLIDNLTKEYIVCEDLYEKSNYYRILNNSIDSLKDRTSNTVIIDTLETLLPRPIYLALGQHNQIKCAFIRHSENDNRILLNKNLMNTIKNKLNVNDFYILPISTQEFICIDKDNQKDLNVLKNLIYSLKKEDNTLLFSDKIYYYNFEEETLENDFIDKEMNIEL